MLYSVENGQACFLFEMRQHNIKWTSKQIHEHITDIERKKLLKC